MDICCSKMRNIFFHGLLANDKLRHLLCTMDLHILLSRNEGFPKVILETAASGIPSILYSDYGAEEWIRHRYNGFVVNNIDDVVTIIKELEKDSFLLSEISKKAINFSKLFEWKLIVKCPGMR